MNKGQGLDQLCRVLRGEPVSRPDWSGIIALANLALITPRLEGCLDAAAAPADVRTFVNEVARRNRERNEHLFRQMGDAAVALNAVGVTPFILKGGALLARSGGQCPRIINDIDLVVAPSEIDAALSALRGAGFSIVTQSSGATLHAVAELGRPQDVGHIDLHQRPPGPPGFVSGPAFLGAGKLCQVGPGEVRVPEPHMHIYLQALHDQLHDGGYWRGGFDLRHAWDIADLIHDEDIDWDRLRLSPPTRLTAHAVEAQLMACHVLTGAPIPAASRGWGARLRHRRQRVQYSVPLLTAPLAALVVLAEAPNLVRHRMADRLGRASAGLPPRDGNLTLGLERVRRVLTVELGGRL